jgi:hypothetical protein
MEEDDHSRQKAEGGGITVSPQIDMDVDHKNGKLIAKAIDDWNNPIGHATFNIGDNNELDPQHVEVNEKHRKSGVAKKIYDHVASHGYKIIRSSDQTDSGDAFWNKHQGINSKFWRTQKDNGGGITAYHGSPHEFDQFDTSKIGTGEGAQSYGHGLYFAEAEPVAKGYRDRLGEERETNGETIADQFVIQPYFYKDMSGDEVDENMNKAADYAEHTILDKGKMKYVFEDGSMLIHDDDEVRAVQKHPGHMYEVSINAHPDHFLDWDKPLSEQGGAKRFLSLPDFARPLDDAEAENITGQRLYQRLENKLGQEKASAVLHSSGLKGIKYLDASSRKEGEGSRNYVVFDHNDVNIKRRYEQGGRVGYDDGGDVRLGDTPREAMAEAARPSAMESSGPAETASVSSSFPGGGNDGYSVRGGDTPGFGTGMGFASPSIGGGGGYGSYGGFAAPETIAQRKTEESGATPETQNFYAKAIDQAINIPTVGTTSFDQKSLLPSGFPPVSPPKTFWGGEPQVPGASQEYFNKLTNQVGTQPGGLPTDVYTGVPSFTRFTGTEMPSAAEVGSPLFKPETTEQAFARMDQPSDAPYLNRSFAQANLPFTPKLSQDTLTQIAMAAPPKAGVPEVQMASIFTQPQRPITPTPMPDVTAFTQPQRPITPTPMPDVTAFTQPQRPITPTPPSATQVQVASAPPVPRPPADIPSTEQDALVLSGRKLFQPPAAVPMPPIPDRDLGAGNFLDKILKPFGMDTNSWLDNKSQSYVNQGINPSEAYTKASYDLRDLQMGLKGRGGQGAKIIKKLMPDGTYQDTWVDYASGGKVGSYPLKNKHEGKTEEMSPQEYLEQSPRMKMDPKDSKKVDKFKKKIKKGKKIGAPKLLPNHMADGRHRATAAMELGIKKIPVLNYRKRDGGAIVDRALMLISKKA